MSRRAWRYAGLGLALYVVFLAATAPASLMAWALARATNNALVLQATSGTLWNGNGELSYARPHAAGINFGRGEWQLNPLWVVLGSIGVNLDFKHPDVMLKAQGRLGFRKVNVRDVDIRLRAALVPVLFAPATIAGPSGDIRITAREFSVSREGSRGQAVALWTAAGTTVSSVNPLGDYRVVASGRRKTVSLALTTDGGELVISGQGSWSMQTRRLQIRGTATPTANSKTALNPLLRLLGRDQGDSSRAFIVDISL